MKTILITHIDLDGAGCAILFKHRFPNIEIQYHDYDTIDKISKELWDNKDDYDIIYFADITPNEEYGMKMVKYHKFKFILIDHHITREYLKGTSAIYDTEMCATHLTSDYLYPGEDVSAFVHAVDAYDTWKLNSPYRAHGLILNLLFKYYKMDKFVKEFYGMRYINDNEKVIIKVLRKIEQDELSEKLEQGHIRIDNNNNDYFEVHVDSKNNNLGLLIDDPRFPSECRYLKVINLNDKTVGLYSKNFDVSKIARSHGGGGHPGAAGYPLKFLQRLYV